MSNLNEPRRENNKKEKFVGETEEERQQSSDMQKRYPHESPDEISKNREGRNEERQGNRNLEKEQGKENIKAPSSGRDE